MAYQIFVVLVVGVVLVGCSSVSPPTKSSSEPPHSSPGETETTASSHPIPSNNVTNLDPDEFYKWLNGFKPTKSSSEPPHGSHVETETTASSHPVPSNNVTNLDPDEFYKWLNGLNNSKLEDNGDGSTLKPIVQTNTGDGLSQLASDKPNFAPEPSGQTPETLTNEAQVSTTIISELDSFYSKLDRMKPTTPNSGSDITVDTTAAKTSTVNPKEGEDIQGLKKVFQDATTKRAPVMDADDSLTEDQTKPSGKDGKRKYKFNLPPPDKFYEWLKSLPKSKQDSLKSDQSQSSVKVTTDELMTSKIIIVSVSVASGLLACFAIIFACIIYKKKRSKKLDDKGLKTAREVYSTGYTDVFHGIPTNNDIWKNLEMMSVNTSSVLPDNHPKV